MQDRRQIRKAFERVKWIGALSKESLPPEAKALPATVRELLNRIVRDVRAAGKLLDAALSDKSDGSDLSDKKTKDEGGLIPTHGGYRNLRSFQVAEIIYDGTVVFCDRFVHKRSRTHDQMVQAARSGRQNIAEGSVASATSKKTELKLTNVAKASLEELLLDYEDFLRQRKLRLWGKNDPEALAVRNRYRGFPQEWFISLFSSDGSDTSERSDKKRLDPYGVAEATPEAAANTLLCLIHQAIYLMKRQIKRQEQNFLDEGGFTEKLYHARSRNRQRSS